MGDYHINIFSSEKDGGYIADIPDLEACSAFGGIMWPNEQDFSADTIEFELEEGST